MLPLPPDVIRWVSRSGEDHDCAIAAIMLATGATYDMVLAEAVRQTPDAVKRGMTWRHIRGVLRALGFSTRLRRKYDLDEDFGILDCRRGRQEHVVYLWDGHIFEPADRSIWRDAEAYLQHEGWTPKQLLTLKKD